MSLVNLSHVCSHLQNASLARLGLTSIPYTRLHLSLSLLLQKQGFLSQVKLAGPSPPASCFPPGADNHHVTSHPHPERGQHTPETALQWIVKQGAKGNAESLRSMGFRDNDVEYAMSRRLKNKAQLENDGWNEIAANFLLSNWVKDVERLREEGKSDEAIAILEKYRPVVEECRDYIRKWHSDREAFERKEEEAARSGHRGMRTYDEFLRSQLAYQVSRADFDVDTLRYFAGDNNYLTERELVAEGVDVETMGQTITNQPFDVPAPEYAADPWQLEGEGVVTQANRASRRLWLGLKYWDGLPVLRKARMLSKPTKRIQLSQSEMGKLVRGRNAGEVKPLTQVGEIMAVSTTIGILEVREAVERKLGGLVLCRIW